MSLHCNVLIIYVLVVVYTKKSWVFYIYFYYYTVHVVELLNYYTNH